MNMDLYFPLKHTFIPYTPLLKIYATEVKHQYLSRFRVFGIKEIGRRDRMMRYLLHILLMKN